jgi:hypothetical protein
MTQPRSLGTKVQFPPPQQGSIPKYPICTLEVPWPALKRHGNWDTMACPLFDIVTRLALNYRKILMDHIFLFGLCLSGRGCMQ